MMLTFATAFFAVISGATAVPNIHLPTVNDQRSPSNAPTLVEGHIFCRTTNEDIHIGANASRYGLYLATEIAGRDKLVVKIDITAAAVGPANMIVSYGSLNTSFPYVGVVTADANSGPPNSFNAGVICGTSQTEPGKPAITGPSSVSRLNGLREREFRSAIWHYNPANKAIFAEWISNNGKRLPVTAVYHPLLKFFAITDNLAEFEKQYGPSDECRLFFDPLGPVPL